MCSTLNKAFSMLSCVHMALYLLQRFQAANSYEKHIYIKPSSSMTCPVENSCLNLSALAASANISSHFDSTTRLIFLLGIHYLDTDLFLSNAGTFLELLLFTDVSTVTPSTSIICGNNASLRFTSISHVQISGLHFIGCSASVEGVGMFLLEDSSFLCSSHGYRSALELVQTNAGFIRSAFSISVQYCLQLSMR